MPDQLRTKLAPVTPVTTEKPTEQEDLLTVTKRGQQNIAAAASKDPHTPLDSKAAQSYLTDLGQLSEKYSPGAPPETQKSLADAMARAQRLYEEKANRNEWLEVAQLLGRAGAQFAAAQSGSAHGGQYGHNMSNLDFGQGIDYGARTDRAARDRAQSVSEASALANAERQSYDDSEGGRKHKFEAQKDYLHQGLSSALREEEIARRELADSDRAARALTGEDLRDQRAVRAARLHELDQEEKSVSGEDEARKAIANQFLSAGDMDSKTLRKLQASQPQLAAKAGIDLNQVATKMEEQETVRPGWLGGKTSEEEQAAKRTILDEILRESKTKLADIKARRAALLAAPIGPSGGGKPTVSSPPTRSTEQGQGQVTAPSPSVTPPHAPTPTPEKIKVRLKATGQTGTLDPKDFDPSKYDRL